MPKLYQGAKEEQYYIAVEELIGGEYPWENCERKR